MQIAINNSECRAMGVSSPVVIELDIYKMPVVQLQAFWDIRNAVSQKLGYSPKFNGNYADKINNDDPFSFEPRTEKLAENEFENALLSKDMIEKWSILFYGYKNGLGYDKKDFEKNKKEIEKNTQLLMLYTDNCVLIFSQIEKYIASNFYSENIKGKIEGINILNTVIDGKPTTLHLRELTHQFGGYPAILGQAIVDRFSHGGDFAINLSETISALLRQPNDIDEFDDDLRYIDTGLNSKYRACIDRATVAEFLQLYVFFCNMPKIKKALYLAILTYTKNLLQAEMPPPR